ncbi:MAG: SLC13 family permease [Planctomycetota bacterium]|nr:SLC13 family permease [Planctomycetota bacterium]MDA1163775.1 SLC13 family permease [Planctomycetota bacterium]
MPWEAWFTVGVVSLLIMGLARNWGPPDLLALGTLTVLIVVGKLSGSTRLPTPEDAVSNFGSTALITVGVLFVIVTGLTQTGAMHLLSQRVLGRPNSERKAQLRLLPPVAALSAFLNNTPIVAMFLPVVDDLCRKTGISQSRLFLPLSYAATFGGLCTLIGTSTNLIINGEIVRAGLEPLGMFELSWVGVPCAVAGMVYILVFSRILLPDRRPAISLSDDPRRYTVEMTVLPGGPLVGRSVEKAGLRHLPGLFLAEIARTDEVIPAVAPHEKLQAGDRLVFVGIIESVVDLKKIRGLVPADEQAANVNVPATQRCLIEAVVSDRCPLIGKTIRDGQFRSTYNAAVLAIARGGERINAKLGDVVLQPGDTLLLESHTAFEKQQRNSQDFFLVSRVENSAPIRHGQAGIALAILAAMVAVVTVDLLDIMTAAMLAAGLMVLTKCCTGSEGRRSVDISLLLMIGSALGIGKAMDTTGAAESIAETLIGFAGGSERAVLIAIYLVTMLFTELITNNAAAVLMFPIALESAKKLGVDDPKPFIVAVMIAASAAFITPFGYQTNLMVYGPGGYRYSDFVRFGLPLSLLFMTICVILVPLVW